MKKILLVLGLFLFVAAPASAQRQNVTEWYIQDFTAIFVINEDSSMTVTEKITADCGNLSGKHGIFRILPKYANTTAGKIHYPIKLLSITDENGQDRKYSTQEGFDTITWKIGDANTPVQGENYYEIKYLIKNVIRNQEEFDEFYWNISGFFWDMEIDNFEAQIIFPPGIDKKNTNLSVYSGYLGDTDSTSARYRWLGRDTLQVYSTETLKKGQGITVSASFPQMIIGFYEPSFEDFFRKEYLWFILPIIALLLSFLLWKKYGDDPDFKQAVIPEYEAPKGLGPIEASMLMREGSLENKAITAAIIKMAVQGLLKINERENKVLFISSKEYELEKIEAADISHLSKAEQTVYDALFTGRQKVKLEKLKKKFYKTVPVIKRRAKEYLIDNSYMEKTGFALKVLMFIIGVILLMIGFSMIGANSGFSMPASFIISGFIIIVFACIMTKKTAKGAKTAHHIKGLKMYIKTAEKHRARFYEEENIFEKVLPYAILFGLTKLWVMKMKDVYGNDYFHDHVPVWYIGSSIGSFDADSFASSMNSIASSSTSSPSGSGGGGFSGGGGGGGGGGGW